MKMAIHIRKGSFSDQWVNYCKEHYIPFITVDCCAGDIIKKLKEEKVTHLMWHINHSSDLELQVFPYVLNSIDSIGIKTFPNFNTRWCFDDKIAQMYYLQSQGAPIVNSFVFYSKNKSLKNLETISFPIVAKLRRGAGATNVYLLNNQSEAKKYIKKIFSKGICPHAGLLDNLDQKKRIAKNIDNSWKLAKKIYNYTKRYFFDKRILGNEKGYFYYQEFLPDNNYDTRIIVVGDKAVGIRRFNRANDFRASGSGNFSYDYMAIDNRMIAIAFEIKRKIDFQSMAFDFIYNKNKEPRVVEICFGFTQAVYESCEGFWDSHLSYHHKKINLQDEMIKDFISN